MAQIFVKSSSGSPMAGIKVAISFSGGAMKDDRTDRRGSVTINGSSNSGRIFVNGRERHSGSVAGSFEFIV